MTLREDLAHCEEGFITQCFLKHEGNLGKTRAELDADKSTIRARLIRYGLWQSGENGAKGKPTDHARHLIKERKDATQKQDRRESYPSGFSRKVRGQGR